MRGTVVFTPGWVDYLDLSGISVEKLPQWMREVQESWQDVTAAYRGAVDRGYAEGVAMNEWRQRQALAGGILLGEDSPFVRLEAFKGVDGKWHYVGAPVRGGAEVAEGQPLKWTKAPTEEVPFGRRPAREPKFSIPSEEELEVGTRPARVTYASSKDELARRKAQLAGRRRVRKN